MRVFPISNYFKSFSSLVNSAWTIVSSLITAFAYTFLASCIFSLLSIFHTALRWMFSKCRFVPGVPFLLAPHLCKGRGANTYTCHKKMGEPVSQVSFFSLFLCNSSPTNRRSTFAWTSHGLWHFLQVCFLRQKRPFSLLLPGQITHSSFKTLFKCHYSLKLLLTEIEPLTRSSQILLWILFC